MNDELQFIRPGQKVDVDRSDCAFWLIMCPHCGNVHTLYHLQYWENGELQDKWYFICMSKGLHVNIDPERHHKIVSEFSIRRVKAVETDKKFDPNTIPF